MARARGTHSQLQGLCCYSLDKKWFSKIGSPEAAVPGEFLLWMGPHKEESGSVADWALHKILALNSVTPFLGLGLIAPFCVCVYSVYKEANTYDLNMPCSWWSALIQRQILGYPAEWIICIPLKEFPQTLFLKNQHLLKDWTAGSSRLYSPTRASNAGCLCDWGRCTQVGHRQTKGKDKLPSWQWANPADLAPLRDLMT